MSERIDSSPEALPHMVELMASNMERIGAIVKDDPDNLCRVEMRGDAHWARNQDEEGEDRLWLRLSHRQIKGTPVDLVVEGHFRFEVDPGGNEVVVLAGKPNTLMTAHRHESPRHYSSLGFHSTADGYVLDEPGRTLGDLSPDEQAFIEDCEAFTEQFLDALLQ